MDQEPVPTKQLNRQIAQSIVARYCEYDSDIPLDRRLCLLSDEFGFPVKKIKAVLVIFLGRNYYASYSETKYW